MFGNSGMSAADVAAVTRGSGNDDGFGGNNGWWILIILFALFGWGNGGYGNRGSGDSGSTTVIVPPIGGYGMGSGFGFTDAAITNGFNNQAVINKLDGINSGICGLGYDQLSQMNSINSNIMQTGFGIQQAINNDTVANMQNANALSTQISTCCCDQRAAIKDLAYDLATQECQTRTQIHETGDAIIQSQNWGFRNLQDTINQGFQNLERQNDQRYIAQLEQQLNIASRDAALQGMAQYVVNQVRPSPVPAYPACNPNGVGNWSQSVLSGNGYTGNNGCGCNC